MVEGKVCLITGANNGFGYETSKALAAMGARVVMVCRSEKRGKAAQARIAKATGNTPDLLLADLLLQSQVKQVVSTFRERYDRLDVLLNNAGFSYKEREETEEGFERTFALNYLAYFTLTIELLDLLRKSAPSRIVNTASTAHQWREVDLDNNLQGERDFPPGPFGLSQMYGWTNAYRIMFTYELSQRLEGSGVVANSFSPGFVPVRRSGVPWYLNMLMPLMRLIPSARSPKQAAQTMIALATAPDYEALSGLFLSDGEPATSSDQTLDATVRKKLWELTCQLLGYAQDPLPYPKGAQEP